MRIAVITNKFDKQRNITNGVRVHNAFIRAGYNSKLLMHDNVSKGTIGNMDLILLTGTALYTENIYQFEIIKGLKNESAKLAFWFFDLCNPNNDYGGSIAKHNKIKSIVKHLDFLFTTDHSYPWENEVEYRHIMQGVDEHEFMQEYKYNTPKEFDIIYAGGTTGCFEYRGHQLSLLSTKYKMDIYGQSVGRRIYGNGLIEAFNNSKIAYVPGPPPGITGDYWSNRIYIATATGIPCLVGHSDGIEKHFSNKEIVTFKGESDMMDKAKYLLEHDKERNAIGKAGKSRTIRCHKYQDRVIDIVGIVGGIK